MVAGVLKMEVPRTEGMEITEVREDRTLTITEQSRQQMSSATAPEMSKRTRAPMIVTMGTRKSKAPGIWETNNRLCFRASRGRRQTSPKFGTDCK